MLPTSPAPIAGQDEEAELEDGHRVTSTMTAMCPRTTATISHPA